MTTKTEEELAAIRAIMKLEGKFPSDISKYTNEKSEYYNWFLKSYLDQDTLAC